MFIRKTTLTLFFIVQSIILISCRTTDFSANSRQKPLVKNVQPIIVDCLKEEESSYNLSVDGNSVTKFVVEGKVCPNTDDIFEKKTVLILVDQSGSMNQNDPVLGGSCSRLDAIRALVEKIKNTEKALDNVFVGLIGFESVAKVLTPPTSVTQIMPLLNVNPICDATAYTNYESAFDTASNLVRSIPGSKNIYFVSDGLPKLPEISGVKPVRAGGVANAGLAAARDLLQISGTELFVLYLQVVARDEDDVADPVNYLNTIAGDLNKVRIVTEAKNLVDEILKFEVKPAPLISVLNPTISLESDGFESRNVEVASIEPDLATKGVWNYKSEPFTPFFERGRAVLNRIAIRIVDDKGRAFFSTVNVSFTTP